eukprot:5578615-Pyramimonas_sp.AAC.1
MASALHQHWAPVFAWKQVPVKHVRRCLEKHARPFDWSEVSPPTVSQIQATLARAKPTAPGPDGLPHAAWQQRPLSAEMLFDLLLYLQLTDMSDIILVFAPKGRREDDSQCVVREVASTRPLALKSADVKVLSSVCNFQFKK